MESIAVIIAWALAVFFVVRRIFKAFKGQEVGCFAGEGEGCGSCSPAEICVNDTES
jgi:hypothetical protein